MNFYDCFHKQTDYELKKKNKKHLKILLNYLFIYLVWFVWFDCL